MADIKTSGQLWAEIGKAVDQAPHKKVSNSQLDDILARLGTPLRDANGRPVKNITGFELDEWKAAGQRAKVVHGLPYPEPSWNPVKWSWDRLVWAQSRAIGYPTRLPEIGDPWARREAWRYTGPFQGRTLRWKGTFPGLGIATGAFAIYLAYDMLIAKEEEHH